MTEQECRELYAKWIVDLSGYLHIFGTFTFPGQIGTARAYARGLRLWRFSNEVAYGRRWREHEESLTTVFAVEARHSQPHIHFMQEAHPALDFVKYRKLWQRTLDAWVQGPAVRIETINTPEAVARYITKQITWENSPFVSIPARVNYRLEG